MLRRVHFGEGKYREMVFFPDENFAPGGTRTGRCGVQQANDPNERGRGSSRRILVEGRSTEMKHFLGYVATIAVVTLFATTAVAGEVVNVAGASRIAVGGSDPHETAARHSLITLLHRLIRKELSPHQRDMLLAELNGMPHDEIAAQMGLTRNAVYKLGHDARRALRRALEAAGYGIEEVRNVLEGQEG
jgi:hypothetical protein